MEQDKPEQGEGDEMQNEGAKVNEDQIYLIDPANRAEPALPDEILDKITEKAITKSKRLVKQAKKEIEAEMNKIIFEQLQKIELKFEFI